MREIWGGLIFLDYSFHFLKVGNLREGEALIVAKAVSPSRALPLLATPLFGVVVGVNVLTGCGIRGCREGEAVPICWIVDNNKRICKRRDFTNSSAFFRSFFG